MASGDGGTRDRLLDAAIALFSSQRHASTSVAALAYVPTVQLLIGRTPGSVDADRFRQAWLRLAEGVFNGTPPT